MGYVESHELVSLNINQLNLYDCKKPNFKASRTI